MPVNNAMKRYRAAQIGLGPRGLVHLHGLRQNGERFEIAGVCDRHPEKLAAAAERFGIPSDRLYTDAAAMMEAVRPEVLSFTTAPHVRRELVELAVGQGVAGLMLEKPMATSLADARYITGLCVDNGIKAVVCHQHKYIGSLRKLREITGTGELGSIYRIEASCQPQLSQLGTHYLDYILWLSGGARAVSVVGHIHGRDFLRDSHPSPDFVLGEVVLSDGVRAGIQCGYFAKPHASHEDDLENRIYGDGYWTDDRLTVYGDTGYAWAECNGRWGVFSAATGGKVSQGDCGSFGSEELPAQELYTQAFADWLDGGALHPCNIEQACHGYEIAEAICLSALDKTRIDLPLAHVPERDLLARLAAELPETGRRRFKQ